jgi:hypothetical protein
MKINKIRLFVLAVCTFISAFTLSSAQAATAYPLNISEAQRLTPAPPTNAKGSLVSEMPPGTALMSEYTIVRLAMSGGATPIPTEEPTTEATPRPRTDTDLEPPMLITSVPPQKEFYIIKTRNEKVFYLIIDHTKVSDNVYLVTEVDEADLLNFVESTQMPALLPFMPQTTPVSPTITPVDPNPSVPVESSKPVWDNLQPAMIIVGVVLLLLAGTALFYWKVIKPKDKLPVEADFYADEYLEDSSGKVNAWKESEGEE